MNIVVEHLTANIVILQRLLTGISCTRDFQSCRLLLHSFSILDGFRNSKRTNWLRLQHWQRIIQRRLTSHHYFITAIADLPVVVTFESE